MHKLSIGFDIERNNYSCSWTEELARQIFTSMASNPFFKDWETMTVGFGSLKEFPFNAEKALKVLLSAKKEECLWVYGGNCDFIISRRKHNYMVSLRLDGDYIKGNSLTDFRDYMVQLAVSLPMFKRLIGSQGSISADTQRKHEIEEEKSIFSYISWLEVLSSLAYEGYYEKEDLLKAPFYQVKEVAPDIVLIQAYKDPFDFENEESLNYLRKGVAYLNKHIVYLKGK